jgi:ribosomal protein S18 acetylase RimI-like enzyme
MFGYRDATDDDLAAICAFPRDRDELYFMFPKASFPLAKEELIEAARARFSPTAILADSAVIGYANFYEARGGGRSSLGNVIVAPAWRGRGAASFLVRTMERIARDRYGAAVLHVSCFNANTAGLLLYTKMGFLPGSIERREGEGTTVAVIHLEKNLGR